MQNQELNERLPPPLPPPLPPLGPQVLGMVAGGLVAAAWIAPVIAAVFTMAVSFVPSAFGPMNAVVAGTVGGGAVWLVVGLLVSPFVSAKERSNPASWEQVASRVDALQARANLLRERQKDVAETLYDVEGIRAMTRYGLHWATKIGYIALWRRIHHGEEALIPELDTNDLWGVIEHDNLRLADATDIASSLKPALIDVARFMEQSPTGKPRPAPAGEAPLRLLGRTMPPVSNLSDARGRLREITAAINTFRDDAWVGLVRLRAQLLAALVLTEAFAYGLLALAVTEKVGHDQMVAAITYFLVGAVTGFFGQLLILKTTTQAVEDYGLSLARLLLIPAVAGLAGLGGVILTDLLLNAPFTSLVQAASGSRAAGSLPPLTDVFDLQQNRGGIIFAILFGYAPNLLVGRLDDLVASYKSAISSTETGTR